MSQQFARCKGADFGATRFRGRFVETGRIIQGKRFVDSEIGSRRRRHGILSRTLSSGQTDGALKVALAFDLFE